MAGRSFAAPLPSISLEPAEFGPDRATSSCARGAAEGLSLVAGALADAGVAAVAVEEFGLSSQRASLTRAGLRCPPLTSGLRWR